MDNRNRKRIAWICAAIIMIAGMCTLCACGSGDSSSQNIVQSRASTEFASIEDYDPGDKTIGVQQGTIYGPILEEQYPDSEVLQFISYADAISAWEAGKIDSILGDEPILLYAIKGKSGISIIDDPIVSTDLCVAFQKSSKGEKLRDDYNEFLGELKESGKFDELVDKWLAADQEQDPVSLGGIAMEYDGLPATNGTLILATDGTTPPFTYYSKGVCTGFEIELAALYCESRGYALKIDVMTFSAILPAISTGKADLAASSISYTDERAESVSFSDSEFELRAVFMVDEPSGSGQGGITGIEDLSDKRVASIVGSTCAQYVDDVIGEGGEKMVMNSLSDLILALKEDKIDAFVYDDGNIGLILNEEPELTTLDEALAEYHVAFATMKNNERTQKLVSQINEYLKKAEDEGVLKELQEKWMTSDNDDARDIDIDYTDLPATNGTIVAATCSAVGKPVAYFKDGKIVGYDVEVLVRFCEEYGYALELDDTDTSGVLSGIAVGKYDLGLCGIAITGERKESMLFTDTIYDGKEVVVIRKSDAGGAGESSFFSSIAESFEKTFVREGRWQLFVGGIVNTLLITLFSLALGTFLGFAVFMLCRKENKIATKIADFCIWLIQGMPTVVLLMIMFYVVLGWTSLSGTVVSIICFTMIFAAAVIGMLRVGVSSVDKGQQEAARAIGYSDSAAFFKITFPQALMHVLPLFESEIIGLLKATAIVGYIAVQDLTKIGDIVRSATYEALFPLVAIAIIYFLLEAAFKFLVKRFGRRLDPTRRNLAKAIPWAFGAQGADAASFEPASKECGSDEIVDIRHLEKSFGDVCPLRDVNAIVRRGDVIGIIGPSGCGKSTLLRCINQLDPPTAGQVFLDGEEITVKKYDISKANKKMGMVFQRFNLFMHWTVVENVVLPQMQLLGRSADEAYSKAMGLLRAVGVADKALEYPSNLSGGQMQRVAIARTLAMDPEIILLDEPTSALDPTRVGEVERVIKKLAAMGTTMMIVTHEMRFAKEVSNRIFYMDEGGIYEDGTPEQIFEHPVGDKTRQFINKLKVLEISMDSRSFDFLDISSRIEEFCIDYEISPKRRSRLLSAFEELCVAMVIPNAGPEFNIKATIEFDENDRILLLKIRYDGPVFDPNDSDDQIALAVLSAMSDSMEHCETEAPFTNCVSVVIKK